MERPAPPVYPHHVVLVSDQPIPTIAPLIDPALGARIAWLVASPHRYEHARWQARVIEGRGIETRILTVEDPYDLPALQRFFDALLERLAPDATALNLTGGSKPMSIAAHERFRTAGCGIYYVRIDTDAVSWLHADGLPVHPIADRLAIHECLQACGVEIEEQDRKAHPQEWISFAETLLEQPAMTAWVSCLRPVRDGLALDPSSLPGRGKGRRDKLHRLMKRGFVAWQEPAWRYASKEAARFLAGGWLEGLVETAIEEIARQDPLMQGIARNLKVSRGEEDFSEVKNELDVVFLRDNTLYLVECKAGKQVESRQIRAVLFGLAELCRRIGGLRGRVALVSLHDLKRGMLQLANALGVHVIKAPRSTDKLKAQLAAWIHDHPDGT